MMSSSLITNMLLAATLSMTVACNMPRNREYSNQQERIGPSENKELNRLKHDRFRACTQFSRFSEDFAKVWSEFSSENSLELARSEDFRFSAIPIDGRYRADIERWTNCPVQIQGDFNGDTSEDLLVLAVSKNSDSAERFSLLIFNSPKEPLKDQFIAAPKYVFRGQDLSTLYVGRSRVGLSAYRYSSDGTAENCHIEWRESTESYECKKSEL